MQMTGKRELASSQLLTIECNPELWSDRGDYEEMLQELKYMWHILVRFGRPFSQKSRNIPYRYRI
jgi:Protein of unknown function (DUF3626).